MRLSLHAFLAKGGGQVSCKETFLAPKYPGLAWPGLIHLLALCRMCTTVPLQVTGEPGMLPRAGLLTYGAGNWSPGCNVADPAPRGCPNQVCKAVLSSLPAPTDGRAELPSITAVSGQLPSQCPRQMAVLLPLSSGPHLPLGRSCLPIQACVLCRVGRHSRATRGGAEPAACSSQCGKKSGSVCLEGVHCHRGVCVRPKERCSFPSP